MKHRKIITIFSTIILVTASLSAQTGGDFTITQSVVASGGGQQTVGGTFSVDGTIGQNVAGDASNGAPFTVFSGFWIPQFAPNAATGSISGRILAADGVGIRNVMILLTNASGETKFSRSSSFGWYRFEEVLVGETYILTVRSKRFNFLPDTHVFTLLDELTNMDFTAVPQ